MKYYVCLRDDDLNYNTQVKDLTSAYEEYWGQVPITLAAIPFMHNSWIKMESFHDKSLNRNRAMCLKLVREWETMASANELALYHCNQCIGENKELISHLLHLQQQKKIEIAQHGVHHRYYEDGKAELISSQIGFYDIRDAKEYLEKVFATDIQVFIPPSNAINYKQAMNVQTLNMHLMTCSAICYHSKVEKACLYLHNPLDILTGISRTFKTGDNPWMKKHGIPIFNSLTFGESSNYTQYRNRVIKQLEEKGAVCLATHYVNLLSNMEYRRQYLNLIEILTAKFVNLEFVTATEYCERCLNH